MTTSRVAGADLVTLAKRGDREARDELARQCRPKAYGFALHLLRNREDAMDVTQESLVRLFDRLDRFEEGRPLDPWLLTIVRNQTYDFLRRRKVRAAESLEDLLDQGATWSAREAPTALELVERGELRARLWQALATLSPEHREILVLRDYQDLSYREIAEVLGVPKGTVMSRLHRARSALRDVLTAGGDLDTAERTGASRDDAQ
jgi:RNA polymerase sigma-70 factor (ECF subfamily)